MDMLDPAQVSPLVEMMPTYWALHRRRFEESIAVLLQHMPERRGKRLLDLGVFPGFMAKLATNAGFKVSGISSEEMTPEFLSFAQGHGIAVSQCDIETEPLPFQDNEFSAVLFTEVVEHLHRNPYFPLAEAFRVLEPGGVLLVTTPNLCRWDTIGRLLGGKSFHPGLDGDFHEAFPVNPNYKHCREYTAQELAHLLSRQNLYPYRYEIEQASFSRCWDCGFREAMRSILRFENAAGCFWAWLLPTLVPRLRSNLVVVARKPMFSFFVPPAGVEVAEGLYAVEEDTDDGSSHRRRLDAPFRWTAAHASMGFKLPEGAPATGLRLRVGVGYLAPKAAGERDVQFAINGKVAASLHIAPSKTYTIVDLPVDVVPPAGAISLDVKSTPWNPASLGFKDDRQLGVMLSWGNWLLYAGKTQ